MIHAVLNFSLVIALFLSPSVGWGAVNFDNSANGSQDSGTSLTYTLTTAGSDRYLVVGTCTQGNADVSAVTFNGDSLTQVQELDNTDHSEFWELVNPDVVTNGDVVVTLTDAAIISGASSWNGVDQSTPRTGLTTNTGSSTTPTVTVSSSTDSIVHDVMCAQNGSTTRTADGSQTERWDLGSPNSFAGGGGSSEAGGASIAMDWTLSFSNAWTMIGFSIDEVSAGVTPGIIGGGILAPQTP